MINTYMPDILRHIRLSSLLVGFAPYKYNSRNQTLCVKADKKSQWCYRISLLLSLLNISLMVVRLVSKDYDLFLMILGITIFTGVANCLRMRWNWNCDSKYVNQINSMVRFEKFLGQHGFLEFNGLLNTINYLIHLYLCRIIPELNCKAFIVL